jgi:TolB-like protein/Tfp pilus assembly protein PilF
MSQGADQEYFADGMAEELLSIIARIPQLRVAARTSSFQFKGENRDLRTIGEQLNVTTLLEGSIRKSGDEVRISVQLVDARDGYCRWSDTYDGLLTDIFSTQEDIARSVASALEATLLDSQVPQTKNTIPEVYVDYLQGKFFAQRRGEEDLEKAVSFFRRAVAADAGYAPAWAWLAMVYSFQAENNYVPLAEGIAQAREAASRALALDENLAVAHAAMGFIRRNYDWNWAGADSAYQRALALEPNNAAVLEQAAGIAWILGRNDDAGDFYRRSLELDPLAARTYYQRGAWAWHMDRLDEAEASFGKVLDLHPEYSNARGFLGRILVSQGRLQEALLTVQAEPTLERRLIGLAIVNHALGRDEEADEALSQLLKFDSSSTFAYQIAEVYAYWGDADQAFYWLNRAYELRDPGLTYLRGSPYLDRLRDDSRYGVLFKKLNLPR